MNELVNTINKIEKTEGTKFSAKEKKFALVYASTGNKTEAARKAGYKGAHVDKQGYKMAQNPKIQSLVTAIQEYQTVEITDDFITQAILKEALDADAPRDRLNALNMLAKTKGMLKDVVEQTNKDLTNEDLIKQIESEFGPEAAQKAREELE
jgi:phage terminase small subunit